MSLTQHLALALAGAFKKMLEASFLSGKKSRASLIETAGKFG